MAVFLVSLQTELEPVGWILLGLWLLVMTCLPVLAKKWGPTGERRGINAGVLVQVAVSVFLLAGRSSWFQTLGIMLFVIISGWGAEFLGSRTGFPFGRYHYTKELKPQLGGVPALVPLAWFMMMPASWAVATGIAANFGLSPDVWVLAPLAGLAFTAWDLFLDPQMVRWNFWQWHKKGIWFGIPLSNYIGWFAVSTLMSLGTFIAVPGLAEGIRGSHGLWLVYFFTLILETIAQVFFWKLRGPATGGFLVMGLLTLLSSCS